MRRLITNDGLTRAELRWGEGTGRWRRIDRGVWAEGPDEPSPLDLARAAVLATGGVASHHLAGVLQGLDAVTLDGTWVTVPPTGNRRRARVCRRDLPSEHVVTVGGVPCTDGLQAIVDLAGPLSDLVWEQALESALRRLTSVTAVEQASTGRGAGAVRARRVLALRTAAAPATESLLEPRRSSAVLAQPRRSSATW